MADFFRDYHPSVNFGFFVSVIGFTMFTNHPLLQMMTIVGAICYALILKGFSGVKSLLIGSFMIFLFTAILNPIFNHQGVTILTYFRDGNPLTLESILYGMSAGTMLVTVMIWFSCHNEIMTSDRLMYLFGRLLPALSLIFSMVLRFVPLYKARIKEISFSRKCIGRDASQGNLWTRLKNSISIFSIFVTWALESSIETSDSMRSRGFGLPGRTAFSLFNFEKRDGVALSYIIITDIILIYMASQRLFKVVYYPSMKVAQFTLMSVVGMMLFFTLCMMPTIICIIEEIRWKYYV